MNVITSLSLKNLKLNKKRTLGTIIGIILSTALICASACLFTSFHKTLIQNAINESGYYHLELYDIKKSDIRDLQSNRLIKNIYTTNYLGVSYFDNNLKDDPYINIYSTNNFDELSFEIIEGRKPTNNNELVVNKRVILNSNLKIGDTIKLNVGTRKTNDDWDLDESNPYHEELEKLVDTKEITYKIVGVFSKYGYGYNYFGITTNEKEGSIDAYISLKDPREYQESISMILGKSNSGEDSKYQYEVNHELLRWEVFAFSDSTISMLYIVISVVIIIIIISSVFCIRNSFAISYTEKIKTYGMLSSIGATKKQIKKSVINEAFMLGIIGIPLGIISGILADFILIKVVNYILDGRLLNALEEILFKVSFLGILLSIILSLITIYLSSITSAKKASRISPIDNIRNNSDIKINSKKLRTPKIINKIFGIGGVLAYKNLKRSKKKYRTTIISLTISIFVFISMNTFITETFNLSDQYYTTYDYNIKLSNVKSLTEETINKMKNFESINKFHVLYKIQNATNGYIKITDKSKLNILEDIMPLRKDCTLNENNERICSNIGYRALEIITLDEESFVSYIKKLKLNYDEIKDKGILVDEYMYQIDGKEKMIRSYKYQKGDKIIGEFNGENISIELIKASSIRPFGLENSYYSGGYLVVNKKYYDDLNFTPYSITIDSSSVDEVIKNIESINSDISITNYEETAKEDRAMKLIISIFLYGFITVITFIGVTTIFNTITSNMELRSKEFAMLKSIGMTKKEFNHMINLETCFYSMKALVYGIILGLIGSYLIYYGFSKKETISFSIPYLPILISILFVTLLVSIIMKYSINKINKMNTIETIRKDNI